MVAFLVALADANVPVQADGVPAALLKKLQPGKISGFLSLGNIGPCVIKVLKRIQADMRLVAGDIEQEAHLPATQVIEVEGVRIGMVHGHLVMPRGDAVALDAVRRWLHVDVLVSASTGCASTRQVGSALLVDPGSITGMRCSHISTGLPSFSLLSVDAGKVTTFTYTQQQDGTVSFQRHDFLRKTNGAVPPSMPPAASSVLAAPSMAASTTAPGGPMPPTAFADAPSAPSSASTATTDAANTAQQTAASAPAAPAPDESESLKGKAAEEEGDSGGARIVTEELKSVGEEEGSAPAVLRDTSGDSS